MTSCLSLAYAADIYVDSASTNSSANGSFSAPYKTIAQVNLLNPTTGTRILFKCGSRWPGAGEPFTPLELKSGLTYDSYTGTSAPGTVGCTNPKPVFSGAINLTGLTWTLYKNGIYRADVTSLVGGGTIEQLVDQSSNTSNLDNLRNMVRARFPSIGAGNYTGVPAGSRFWHIDNANTPVSPVDGTGAPLTTVDMWMDPSSAASTNGKSLVGATAYVHSYDWFMASYKVTAHDLSGTGKKLTVTLNDVGRQYNMPIKTAGGETGGYWLENQLWMLDAPGEWFFGYDPADTTANANSKYLYVYRPNNSSGAAQTPDSFTTFIASVGKYGITGGMSGGYADSSKVAVNFTVRNIKLQDHALDGMLILGNNSNRAALNAFAIDGVEITRSGRHGIAVRAADATALAQASRPSIKNSRIDAARADGITLKGSTEPISATATQWMNEASGINIQLNMLTNDGLETFGIAAIAGGSTTYVQGNTVTNTGSRGIDVGYNSNVQANVVTGACVYFNDCGAFYTVGNPSTGTNSSKIQFNYANGVGGASNLDGRHPSSADFNIGFYLDDFASGVNLLANNVTGADYGINVHGGSGNAVSGNVVVDSRKAALTLGPSGSGATYREPSGNTVYANSFVMTASTKTPLVVHTTGQASSTAYATYKANHYAGVNAKPFMDITTVNGAQVTSNLNFNGWKASGRDADTQEPSTMDLNVSGYAANASNMVTNGDFTNGTNNWLVGLAGTSMSLLTGTAQGCKDASNCIGVSRAAGSSDAYTLIVTAGAPFNVQAGKTYMLSFDAKAASNGIVLGARIGDLGNYAGLSRWGDSVSLTNGWRRYYLPLEAQSASGASGARIEFFGYDLSGNRILLDNVKLVTPTSNPEANAIVAFANSSSSAQSYNCPATIVANCSSYIYQDTRGAASFPDSVSSRSIWTYVLQGTDWRDDDGDGVPNLYDVCKNSAPTDIVDTTGCTY